jgi:hypothetical protein
MQEESQELETTESQADGQPEAAEGQVEDSAIEQIGQLLGNPQEASEQSLEKEEPAVSEEPKTEELAKEPVESVIDDTMINEYPALKMYKGKPLKDLGKAYQNIVKAFTENQMRLKQIEKEKAKRSIPEPSEVPDPVEKPQEFKKYLQDFADSMKKQGVEEYISQPREPQVDWVLEARKVVPEGVDFDSFRNDFMMFNAERFYNELGEVRPEVETFYNANPQILISEMKKHYELTSKANKSKTTIEKESKDTAYKTIKTSLKKAQENKEDLSGAQFNATNRTEQVSQEDEILANIYKIAQGQ